MCAVLAGGRGGGRWAARGEEDVEERRDDGRVERVERPVQVVHLDGDARAGERQDHVAEPTLRHERRLAVQQLEHEHAFTVPVHVKCLSILCSRL